MDALGGGSAASCGINLNNGSLTISGEDGASLTVYGGPTEHGNSCGIYANGTITIDSGTVNATGESASADSYGIYTLNISNSITVNGGTVIATAGNAVGKGWYSCGIRAEGSITITDGTVNVKGGNAAGTGSQKYSSGLFADANITVISGTVKATAGDSVGSATKHFSFSLCARDSITINGGSVTATAGNAGSGTNNYSSGVFSYDNLNISGGDVTGIGGKGEYSWGIACNDILTIVGGTVVGKGGPLAGTKIQYSAGVNGMGKVEISGGTVTGTGGDTEAGDSFGICTGDTTSYNVVTVSIKDATVTATGGAAPNGKSSGISATNTIADVDVTIKDATVTATGGAAKQGSYGILMETGGTSTVTIDGNSVVRANTTDTEGVDSEPNSGIAINTTIKKENGIVFENGEGTVYGNVTLRKDLTVGADESLTIPQGATLTIPDGVTLTNSGDITNEGTIINSGTLNIEQGGTLTGEVTGNPVVCTVTVLTDGNGSVSASATTAAAGTTVTLTAKPDSGYRLARWEVVEGDVTISGNSFTMPAENVTVRAVFSPIVNIPDTYDIDLIVGEGGEAKLSLTNASAGSTITVTATPDDGYELDYITVDGERISGTTFTMPDNDVTVRVYFTDGSATLPFTDVSTGAWYFEAVSYVYVGGLMDGVSDTLFDPDGTMTRAMVWAILARVDGETVTGEDWIETAREWAVAEGVTDGENATDYVTREQLATMLWRYAGEPETDGSGVGVFDDGETVSIWAFDAMSWALNNGVITGVSDDALLPANTATRAQCAAMLMRFVETNS